mmetsp:Transcript_150475/g.483695  ORF Transcript_150475/g.483695 Transcript_150475/m.483695 type:complete len:292 (-) Transcript_150475:800-1675(-)
MTAVMEEQMVSVGCTINEPLQGSRDVLARRPALSVVVAQLPDVGDVVAELRRQEVDEGVGIVDAAAELALKPDVVDANSHCPLPAAATTRRPRRCCGGRRIREWAASGGAIRQQRRRTRRWGSPEGRQISLVRRRGWLGQMGLVLFLLDGGIFLRRSQTLLVVIKRSNNCVRNSHLSIDILLRRRYASKRLVQLVWSLGSIWQRVRERCRRQAVLWRGSRGGGQAAMPPPETEAPAGGARREWAGEHRRQPNVARIGHRVDLGDVRSAIELRLHRETGSTCERLCQPSQLQ